MDKAEIHNLKELNELGRDLKINDIICFTTTGKEIYKYGIYDYNASNEAGSNEKIFTVLGLNEEEKYKLATKCYGYEAGDGSWPCYKLNDFKAVERLIREIYRLLDDDSMIDPKDKILSRFEILDI